jgi:hypothetical protein
MKVSASTKATERERDIECGALCWSCSVLTDCRAAVGVSFGSYEAKFLDSREDLLRSKQSL